MTRRHRPQAGPPAAARTFSVDRDALKQAIHHRTGAPMNVVDLGYDQLVAAGDVVEDEDPTMPSGWRVTPCLSLARHLAGHLPPSGGR